jgi:hypothetical protein
MEISKATVGFILAAGVTAGAAGAYFARQSADTIDVPVAAATDGTGGSLAPDADALEAPAPVEAPARTAAPPAPRPALARPARAADVPAPPVRSESPAAAAADDRALPISQPETPVVAEAHAVTPPAPAGPELIELVVAADSVIGLQLATTISSERARVEDTVEAHVVRDVRVGDRVAIPAGSRVSGEVTLVERGGRVKERARLGVRFTSVALPDGTRLAIQTEPIYREGDSQAASSSTKIGGGAIGGAIIGGILGGAKGAAIGGSVGAGAGTAAVMAGGRNQATLPSGSPVTVRVEAPIVITVER